MLGDKYLKGLVHICGKCINNCHLICSSGLKLLESLINPSFTNCSSEFFTIFVNMSSKYLLKLELDKHISNKQLKSCKRVALRLLNVYKKYNHNYDESKLIKDKDSIDSFYKWQSWNSQSSIKAEQYNLASFESSSMSNINSDFKSSSASKIHLHSSQKLGPIKPKNTLNPSSMTTLASKLRNDRLEFKMKNAMGGYVGKENRGGSLNQYAKNCFLSHRSIGSGGSFKPNTFGKFGKFGRFGDSSVSKNILRTPSKSSRYFEERDGSSHKGSMCIKGAFRC